MECNLFAYTLTVYEKRNKNSERPFGSLHPEVGGDLFDVFDTQIADDVEWPAPPDEGQADTRNTIHRVEHAVTDERDPRIRFGRIRVSRTSVRHDVEQAATGAVIPIHEDDREGRPIFYWFVAPTGTSTGMFLTERLNRFGIVTTFWDDHLLRALRERYPDLTFSLNYYVEQPIWDEYLEHGGGLKRAVLKKAIVEEDESKELDTPTRRRKVGTVTTTIDKSVVPVRERVAEMFRNNDRAGAIELLLGDGEIPVDLGSLDDYDSMSIDVDLDGKNRRVIMGRERYPQIGYPIDGIPLDNEGYPDIDALATAAGELAQEIGGPIGLA